MRIALLAGHNVYVNGYFDNGASGNGLKEASFVKETVSKLIPLLKNMGHTVKDCTPYNGHFKTRYMHHKERAGRVAEFKPDIVLDIHLNAYNRTANGVEVLLNMSNPVSKKYANKIINNISSLGIKNRGLKDGSKFYTVKLNDYPSMIVEGAFIDNASDMNKLTTDLYAKSIAKAFGEIKEGDNMNVNKEIELKVNIHGHSETVKGVQIRDEKGNPTNYIPVAYLRRLGLNVEGREDNITITYK